MSVCICSVHVLRLFVLMNSMVLTSGEVTGLSQDRVSKQDAVAGKHKKQVVWQADTTVSEKELWDQGVQVTLLIHEGAIVLHSTIVCECPEWNKRESRS